MRSAPQQLPLGLKLRDSSVFESYLPGSNAHVVAALQALYPEAHRPAVWLCGSSGTGKTHLLQALCARAGRNQHSAAYWPLKEVAALGPDILSGCGRLAWVCLDDVDAVAGRDDWEKALFALHTELEDGGGRCIVAATPAPAGVPFRLKDLASRFGGGMVLKLSPLKDDEQIKALQLHARQRGLELPEEAAVYLLHRLPRDMHSLCAFLDTLDAAALVAQRRLTVPFVSSVIQPWLRDAANASQGRNDGIDEP